MQRIMFEKGKKYIMVFQSPDGEHKETRQYNNYIPDYLQKYRLVGIFEMITVRGHSWEEPTDNPKEYIGIPEGKIYCSWSNCYKPIEYDKIPMRTKFQNKLKQVLKKAKELIELGIDRKAALQAARKCSRHI